MRWQGSFAQDVLHDVVDVKTEIQKTKAEQIQNYVLIGAAVLIVFFMSKSRSRR
jgi:hypothetical protein